MRRTNRASYPETVAQIIPAIASASAEPFLIGLAGRMGAARSGSIPNGKTAPATTRRRQLRASKQRSRSLSCKRTAGSERVRLSEPHRRGCARIQPEHSRINSRSKPSSIKWRPRALLSLMPIDFLYPFLQSRRARGRSSDVLRRSSVTPDRVRERTRSPRSSPEHLENRPAAMSIRRRL